MSASADQVRAALSRVMVPGLARDIVSFGFVENLEIEGRVVHLRLSLPSGDQQAVERMAREAHEAVSSIDGVDEVRLDVSAPLAAGVRRPALRSGRY